MAVKSPGYAAPPAQSPHALSTGVSEGNMKPSSCLCLGVDFFGDHCNHDVFVAPADHHVQPTFFFNDVADIIGGDHRLSVDADDDVILLEATTATQRETRGQVPIPPGLTLHQQRRSSELKGPGERVRVGFRRG